MSIQSEIRDVDVILGGQQILHQVSMLIPPESFVTLLGPSGSGKTTTLNVLAGFVRPESGHVLFDGETVERLSPEDRSTGIVFQDYALFPHLTVAENVAFPLRARKIPKSERIRRVLEMLELVRLPAHSRKRVTELSGGQRQRVAIARALVFEPRMLLLDEPLAALDKHLREDMQRELRQIQRQMRITTVAVTHDQSEALVMSDYVAIMKDGRIQQFGTPSEVYRRPCNEFVASFLGEANILGPADELTSQLGLSRLCPNGERIVIRPENVRVEKTSRARSDGFVEAIEFHGSQVRISVRIGSGIGQRVTALLAPGDPGAGLVPDDPVQLTCDANSLHVLEVQGGGDGVTARGEERSAHLAVHGS